jgi:TPR repeat protein
MKDGFILELTNDSVEERGLYNQISGDKLIARGEFKKAFTVNMISAKEGFAPCQNNIGYAYEHGEGVSQNLTEAVRWYKMAADQNHQDGQYNLSQCYLQGTGVQKNHEEGMRYLISASNNGHIHATYNLACIFDSEGRHVQAFECYKVAAESGFPAAQHNLAICFLNGEGTNRNEEKALHWFKAAARQGFEDAIQLLRANGLY